MTNCLVIVPTYNERENIGRLTLEILAQGPEYAVLVVDDNSPDGTGDLADELAQAHPARVAVLHREGKQGLGSAYIAGFRYGLERHYEYLFQMDADFSHHPKYLPALRAAAQETGIAIGSRLVQNGRVENWGWHRVVISRGGSFYARLVLGLKVKDSTGGFKCFARSTLQGLNLIEQKLVNGFGFQVQVNYLCERHGYKVQEVPIVFTDRTLGHSKMSRKIFLEAFVLVGRLRLSGLEGLERKKPRQPKYLPTVKVGPNGLIAEALLPNEYGEPYREASAR